VHRYNAELAPAELRGSLVSLQQLAICFGIMISYWIGETLNNGLDANLKADKSQGMAPTISAALERLSQMQPG